MISINEWDHRQRREFDFKGLSTDVKPTTCSINSLFLELDTGDFYYFDGSDWNKVGGDEE